jgi:hypothetical protein
MSRTAKGPLPASGRGTAACQTARRVLDCENVLATGRPGRKKRSLGLLKEKFSTKRQEFAFTRT